MTMRLSWHRLGLLPPRRDHESEASEYIASSTTVHDASPTRKRVVPKISTVASAGRPRKISFERISAAMMRRSRPWRSSSSTSGLASASARDTAARATTARSR